VDAFVVDLSLKVCCPEVWMVIVLMPAEAHGSIGPLDTLYVCPFSWPP
jgi:hypothetical protein